MRINISDVPILGYRSTVSGDLRERQSTIAVYSSYRVRAYLLIGPELSVWLLPDHDPISDLACMDES